MLLKKGSVLVAGALTLLSLMSVGYFSCMKSKVTPYTCTNVTCDNGGHCERGFCLCPVGYDGYRCSNESRVKFYGNWKVTQVIVGSTDSTIKGKDTTYNVSFKKSGSVTTFLVDNFMGDTAYNNIICYIDTGGNGDRFVFDTTQSLHMIYDNFRIQANSTGLYDEATKRINGTLITRHLEGTVNWQIDTFALRLDRL